MSTDVHQSAETRPESPARTANCLRWTSLFNLPYIAGLLVLALPSLWHEDLAAIYFAGVGIVSLKYIAEIKDKFQELFGVEIKENKAVS